MQRSTVEVEIVEDFDLGNIDTMVKHDYYFYGIPGEDFVIYYRKILFFEDKLKVVGLKRKSPKIIATRFAKEHTFKARGSISALQNSIEMILELDSGVFQIHGACVSRNGMAILMPAMPNTGKTLTTAYLLQRGFEYLADDTIIVDIHGNAYANPFPSAVNTSILKIVNVPLRKRLSIKLRTFLTQKIPGGTKIFKPYMFKCWEEIPGAKMRDKARIEMVVILERGNRGLLKIGVDEAANMIQAINRYSLPRPYENPVLRAYTVFNPDWEELRKFELKECEALRLLLERVRDSIYILSTSPDKMGEMILRHLL